VAAAGLNIVTTSLRVGTFTRSLVLHLAERTGRLAASGLVIDEVSVTSSPAQFAALASGELDAVLTSPDNVLAYQFLSENPLGQRIDLTVYAAIDNGLGLSLWTGPGVDVETLRGGVFGVDVATSGFAFVGYELLSRLGVAPDEVLVTALGSTPARAAALLAGQCDATILNASNELRAGEAGATRVGNADDLGPYLGTVLAGLRDVDETARTDLRLLRSVLLDTIAHLVDPANEATVVAAIADLYAISPTLATEHYNVAVAEGTGVVPDGAVRTASIDTLVTLRRRYAPTGELDRVTEGLRTLVDGEFLR